MTGEFDDFYPVFMRGAIAEEHTFGVERPVHPSRHLRPPTSVAGLEYPAYLEGSQNVIGTRGVFQHRTDEWALGD
jgi:hypothetical protein